MTNPGDLLGARQPTGTVPILLFIPSVTRDHVPIDQKVWQKSALEVLGKLFRGATAFPPGQGVWRDDERNGQLVFDDTVLVITYASVPDCTPEAWRILRVFLHRMGRETNQGEIGLVVDGEYLGITQFDHTEGVQS